MTNIETNTSVDSPEMHPDPWVRDAQIRAELVKDTPEEGYWLAQVVLREAQAQDGDAEQSVAAEK